MGSTTCFYDSFLLDHAKYFFLYVLICLVVPFSELPFLRIGVFLGDPWQINEEVARNISAA